MFADFFSMFTPFISLFHPVWPVLVKTAFIWLPIFLGWVFITAWLQYIRTDFLTNQGYFFVEVKLPREIQKSPKAMEIFLTGIWQKPTSTFIESYWTGKVQPWFSLELCSFGGQIKFFIWGPKKYRNIVEAQLYAQYPEVEISEAADYAAPVKHDLSKMFMWGTYFKLNMKDVYPIKTYIDYDLDNSALEEEQKIDPITPMLEYLGAIRPSDQVWIQFLIMGHQSRHLVQGHLSKSRDWFKDADAEIERIKKEAGVNVEGKFPYLTKGQQQAIESIERSKSKYPYDTIMRAIYISPPNSLDEAAIPGLIGSVKQFNYGPLNGFKLGWFTDFDYPWMDFARIRRTSAERKMLKAYKMRSGFHIPFKNFHVVPMVFSTEELATLYHFPGSVARTPTLPRIESRRSEPPPNLPI